MHCLEISNDIGNLDKYEQMQMKTMLQHIVLGGRRPGEFGSKFFLGLDFSCQPNTGLGATK